MITLTEIERRYGIHPRKSNSLIDAGKITLIQRGEGNGLPTYVSVESVEAFIKDRDAFFEEYVYAKEVVEELKLFHPSRLVIYVRNYEKLNENFTQEKDFMKAFQLSENYYGNSVQTTFFKKKDVEKLKRNYIDFNEAHALVGISESMSKWLDRRKNIQVFTFGYLRNQKFVRRDSILAAMNYNFQRKTPKTAFNTNRIADHKVGYFTQTVTMEMLKITKKYLVQVISNGLLPQPIKHFNGVTSENYFKEDAVLALQKRQKEEYAQLTKDYYSKADIKDQYPNINLDSLPKTIKRKVEIPYYLTSYFKADVETLHNRAGKYLFHKEDVKNFNSSTIRRESLYGDVMYSDPFKEFKRRLEVLRIQFSPEAEITKGLWFEYVAEYLNSREVSHEYVTSSYLHKLTRATEILTDICDREIFEYNSRELNMIVMKNDELYRHAREVLYQFVIFVNKVILNSTPTVSKDKKRKPFNMEKLFNPITLPRSKTEKKIYSEEEYSLLFKYANDIEKHKENAVNDALKFISNGFKQNTYKKYDSAWLYVLLHLNNAWRHGDCLNVPRISLEDTDITDLNWFLDNNISEEDAKKIIFRFKAAEMLVGKTGVDRHFFCAPQLEKAVATAVAICELRTRAYNDSLETIIFKVNTGAQMAKPPKKHFFQSFPLKDFDFQNRAMNRTLISLIGCIQSKSGDAESSEYLRILRDHVDFETTDIYNIIPQERLDEIALQLFDRDMFGHIPSVLAEMLFGDTKDEMEKTEQIKAVRTNFGDIYKIEETSEFINNILSFNESASQAFLTENLEFEDIIENIIRGMSSDELKSLYNRLITGQMPSKKKDYQCIVSEANCKFPGRDCDNCPLKVPNFYSLSSLVERIFQKVKTIEESLEETLPDGERTRLANWLALDLDLLKYAQKKYGKQEIAMFAAGLNEKLKLVNPIRQFQSIGKSEGS
jgi:hypothetical protein